MSQEDNTRNSYFTWSLFLGLLVLVGLLAINVPGISRAVGDNLAALTSLRVWGQESTDISQVICEKGSQPLAPVVEPSQAAAINSARSAYFSEACESALAYWTLAAENDPQNETVAVMRYLSSGLDSDLLPASMTVEETAEFLQGLGSWAEQNQMDDQAAHWFANAFEVRPSRGVADRLVRLQQDDAQRTSVWRQLAIALPEDDPDHWWALGQQADQARQWSEAAAAYKAGARIAPDPFEFLMAQGTDYFKLDRLDEAQALFEQAVSLKPDRSQPYLQLGNVLRQKGDHRSARNWYEQAVQIAPDKFNQNYMLGLTYYDLSELQLAEQYLTRAVEIKSQNSAARYYLAQTLFQRGRQVEALAILEEAVRLDEDGRWNWLDKLGDWRAAVGDNEGALEAYYHALRLQPDLAKIAAKIENIENP